jgi:GGDEF domain-containing protein
VVCRHTDGPEDTRVVARRISDSLAQEISLSAGKVELSASIGVAFSTRDMSAEALSPHRRRHR